MALVHIMTDEGIKIAICIYVGHCAALAEDICRMIIGGIAITTCVRQYEFDMIAITKAYVVKAIAVNIPSAYAPKARTASIQKVLMYECAIGLLVVDRKLTTIHSNNVIESVRVHVNNTAGVTVTSYQSRRITGERYLGVHRADQQEQRKNACRFSN
jgi:hypothetical protein